MLLERDSPDAWRRAFANRREQAWSPGEFGLVEHAGRAGTHRECAQQFVQRLSQLPHLRVGAEVAGVPSLAAAGDPYARHGLPRRYRQIRVGLVVAELHVETGIELLDPRVFESERLQFGADDRPFEATCGEHHRLRARMQQVQRLEIVGQPVAQAFRLADVDHASFAVPPFVDSGLGGDISGLRPEQVARVPQQRSPVPVHFGDRIRSVRLPAQRIGRFSPHFG